ncbi:hypothetical protein QTP70_004178 [Hemibagrus guttatus]|uniref:ribonuclease H n=1 Tax=Hemibagrus guttatus TaxID=175788 RepID=A0AAE0RFE9_9TELE|nr:hypothetical protein QTP70_004178 [Hemibagrus guttatus]
MKVSRSKTEYMCVNEREGSGTVRLQGEEVKKVQEFKYLGSTVQSNGECGKEVKKRVQAETVSLRKRQESELEVAELKMLRFSLGVTRLDRIRNEYIRGTAHVGRLGDKVREARLRWFGHVQRRDNLEKAYDRVPREELWYCMRKSRVAEKYVRVVQDMYERSRTVVRCAVGQTEEFNVEVGLHQGSALSPFLFAMVMDQLSEEVRQESPWTMMFADDIVICSESREQVEENLERWRFALERRGMKVSRIQSNGECGKEVKKRVQAETVSLRKRQESELEVAELKMLRFSLGVTRLDRIRNEYIRGTAHVGRLGDKLREARLRWFRHVQRRESEYIGRRMFDMKLPGRRQREGIWMELMRI